MVRYERFGLGETWNDEFGTAADPEQLGWLLGYSPYHHVRDGVSYPASMFHPSSTAIPVDRSPRRRDVRGTAARGGRGARCPAR